jgi:hypothetical protein
MMATSPWSPGSPVHFGRMSALSGWLVACDLSVSSMTTFERSRLREERSLMVVLVVMSRRVASR